MAENGKLKEQILAEMETKARAIIDERLKTLGLRMGDAETRLKERDRVDHVYLKNNQTVNGIKTFGSIPVLPASDPIAANQAVRKDYVDKKPVYGTMIFNPDPHTEATSVDGIVARMNSALTWADIRDEAGTSSADSGTVPTAPYLLASQTEDRWQRLMRAILLFDTSDLPDDCTIVSATFSFWCDSKTNTTGETAPYGVVLVGSTPASNIALVNADYGQLGATAFVDNALLYGSISIIAYNVMTLNAAGLAAISKAGITKLGLVFLCDFSDVAPNWVSGTNATINPRMADHAIKSTIPKLKITFTYA